MAFTQQELQDIQNAQQANPTLAAAGINLAGVAQIETGGSNDPATAVSSTGAQGLFQVLPSTAASPGYGVTSLPAGELDDPADNANFAGSYLSGLVSSYEAKGDTPAQAGAAAINEYSGGGYNLAQVQSASSNLSGTTQPNSAGGKFGMGGLNDPSQNQGGSLGNGAADSAQGSSLVSGTYAWIVELVERSGFLLLGTALLLVGLVFLFIDSRTVTTSVRNLVAA